MAFSSPMNDPATRSGSIATRPKIRYGGDGTNSTNPEGGKRSGGQARLVSSTGMPMASPAAGGMPPPTRRDNILTARADGTFDAKRNAFNAGTAQHGRTMDEAGNITGPTAPTTAPRPTSQLVPGRSAGSMVMPTAAPAPAPAPASPAPAPQAPASPTAPAPAAHTSEVDASTRAAQEARAAQAVDGGSMVMAPAPGAPMSAPSTATASAGKIPPPQSPPAPAARLTHTLQRTQSPSAAPPPPSPALPPQVPSPASGNSANSVNPIQPSGTGNPTAAAPAPRKPGMINDGQGFRPASEVNAGLRQAQESRAAVAATPAPALPPSAAAAAAPRPAPRGLNQAAVDAHWTPERRAASRKEEDRIRAAQQAKEDAARLAAVTPQPKPKSDEDYAKEGKWRAQWADIESNQKARETTQEIMRRKESFQGRRVHAKSTPGAFTVSGKPRFAPPPPSSSMLVGR